MDMEKDTDLFRGQGDYQFDVYRKMRKLINKDWSASDSRTNVFVCLFFLLIIGTFQHFDLYPPSLANIPLRKFIG